MSSPIQQQLASIEKNLDARPRSEKALMLGIVLAGLVLMYLSVVYDPLTAEINGARAQLRSVESQITAQQTAYQAMLATSQEDPNKFANDRLAVIAREQRELDERIQLLAGDLVTPNDMILILTELLERQDGLQLVHFENLDANPLREGVSNATQILQQQGTLNLDDVVSEDVVGQVYEHGLVLEFEGDFFSTLKYLRFVEEVTGSFFWDGISYRMMDWPNAAVRLEIHTLSTNQGFIGV